jgi:two-component system nitrogen regulation response regulator GlnG
MRSTGNVWVVDDDESIRWVLERALSQAGIQQECFEDAEACCGASRGSSRTW